MSDLAIKVLIDVMGALDSGRLDANVFAFDNNRRGGSTGQGTSALRSAVTPGTRIIWMVAPLECEIFAEISAIDIDPTACAVEQTRFPGTDVTLWRGTVKNVDGLVPYDLTLSVGHAGRPMPLVGKIALIGRVGAQGEAQS